MTNERELLEEVTTALGDLSFECCGGICGTTAPTVETYNRTFGVLEKARAALASQVVQEPPRLSWSLDEAASALLHTLTGSEREEDATPVTLFVGESRDDDGKPVYGLHAYESEYPEEGVTPLVEFAAPLAAGEQQDSVHLTARSGEAATGREDAFTRLTLDELWLLRDRSMNMAGQYELAIQLLFARKNGLSLTDEQSADLDAFLAMSADSVPVPPSPAPVVQPDSSYPAQPEGQEVTAREAVLTALLKRAGELLHETRFYTQARAFGEWGSPMAVLNEECGKTVAAINEALQEPT